MIDIPRAECQNLINRWRRDSELLGTKAHWAAEPDRLGFLQLSSCYTGCARALEIVLETVEEKYRVE